ncbi:Melanopsin [Dirofilaria immitis]|nr:Melanopsin [Dirofilaria immitis]
MRIQEEYMMAKSDEGIFDYPGNETIEEKSIQADDSIQMKCYESDNFQIFQKTASFRILLNNNNNSPTVDDLLLAASIAATIFNVLVIFCAMKLFRRSGDTMHLFIISMTVGDLLLTVFCHPNEFLIRKHELLRHIRLCAITHFCNWLGLAVSGLSLTMLNLDKLIYFQWPLNYDRAMSKKRASVLCIFIWTISIGYVTWVWVFNVVYIGKNCNLQMASDQMYFYDIFMVTYCVLPVTSSLIVSGYLYQLTREKRHSAVSIGQSLKFKNKHGHHSVYYHIAFSTFVEMHLFEWNTLDCDTQSKVNWLAYVLLYLLFLNPIINPLITALIYAPYRVTLRRFLFSIPHRNRSLHSYRENQTNLSYTCVSNRRSRGYHESDVTLDHEMMNLKQKLKVCLLKAETNFMKFVLSKVSGISPAIFSEVGFQAANRCKYLWNSMKVPTRWCSNEPIFKVHKKFCGMSHLNSKRAVNQKHRLRFKQLSEKLSLKLELRKARSLRPQDQVTYTKEMLMNLNRSASYLYFDCANRFPYLKLCTALCLPDYLSTWYKLTLMHTWMLLVRLQSVLEAAAFIRIRNSIIEIMFDDIDKRLRIVSEEMHEMLYHKRTNVVWLGFLSEDTALAGALWRNLYMQRSVDPVYLNRAVHYVRGTMAYLDSLSLEEILLQGIKNWKIANPDKKLSDKNVFEMAENVAHSLMKQRFKH